ncbi:MAG TPA: patatin-like phospholipase family protein [Xanthomonadales bacterium]|nr:patatin-like phospholipase family protein [Xanthomonadales bacterium]
MLSLYNAETPRKQGSGKRGKGPKIGLAIAGGGPVGAIYELGALQAIDEALDGARLHELDIYIGISAGSFIVSSLANDISSAEICRTVVDHPAAEFSLNSDDFFRPDFQQYLDTAKRIPSVLKKNLLRIIKDPYHSSLSAVFDSIGSSLPSGIFDSESIELYLRKMYESGGRTNNFSELDCTLYLVAVNLDTGTAVRFGDKEHSDVPISKAVQASAALPALYTPVPINGTYYVDGALRRTLHASAALDEGVDLLIGINPLVPFSSDEDGDPRPGPLPVSKLVQGGLPMILSQTFRALIQSRMQVGFKKYRKSHPGSDLMLLEPNQGDEQIFFTNAFSFSSRNALCDHAYRTTRLDLLNRADELQKMLGKFGITVNREILEDKDRSLQDSLSEGYYGRADVSRNLSRTLKELEHQLKKRAS